VSLSSPQDIAALVVAASDLQVVRLVRDAIRTADIQSGKGQPVSGLGPAPSRIERRFRLQPETEILPRRRIEPEPRIEPRRVIHPVDRYEPKESYLVPVPIDPCYKCCPKSPIQPPWKVLPWHEQPKLRVVPKVKVVLRRPDTVGRGSLIDVFI
jgi:hypothetical protein